MYVGVMPADGWTYVSGAHGGQKRVSDILGLKLPTPVSCHVCAGNWKSSSQCSHR